MKNEDVELINRVLDGDDDAFSVLVSKYQKSVHALVWRKIEDFHIAEDITQETFLKAYQELASLKKPQRFSSWLYVIATNHSNTWLRKRRLSTQSIENTSDVQIENATYSEYISSENERTVAEVQREVVKKILGQLQESDRTVMTLYYLGEMSYEEISEFLGISVSAIKNRLYRARQRLKKEEPMIRKALEHFNITPNLTENIMSEISRTKQVAPTSGKPFIPWMIAASTVVLIALMLGIGNQHLTRFQKPYSLDAQSEMKVELVDTPIVLNLESKSDHPTQLKNANLSENNTSNQQPDNISVSVAEAQSEKTNIHYSQWKLPKKAKARLGKGSIKVIQYSPDAALLAVGTNIGVWLYDVETGEEKTLFPGMCQSIAFSPDSRFLANGGGRSSGTRINLWEIATEREVLLTDMYDSASTLKFTSDGKTLVSISNLGDTITRSDVETGKGIMKHLKTGSLNAFGSDILDAGVYAITHDKVAIGRRDGKIQIWDTSTHKELFNLNGHSNTFRKNSKDQILALTFSYDGTRLASGSTDTTVRLWDTDKPDDSIILQKHTGWTNVLSFSPNGKMLASGSTDKTVQLWDTTTGKILATFTGHINGITALAFSPDSTTLASGSTDGTIKFWHTETGNPLTDRITGHTQWTKAATFFKDSSTLASVAFNGVITLWDVKTMQKSTVHTVGHRDLLSTLAFTPDGTKLVSVGADGSAIFESASGHPFSSWQPDHLVSLTDVRTGREVTILNFSRGIAHMIFSPNGKTVAFGSLGEIHLWNTETGNELNIRMDDQKTNIHNMSFVTVLAFSPDGTTLVSGTDQGDIQGWNVETGKALPVFAKLKEQEDLDNISALNFSPDGTLLAAGVHNQIHIWEVNTGNKLLSVKTEHKRGKMIFQSYPEPLEFSPDGTILVNGLNHGAIQLWDVTTGNQIAVLDGHTQKVETLTFSSDNKTLVSTAMDGTILLWDWDEISNGSLKNK